MAHPVLVLGTAVLTAAGSAWYLPALIELRAGDDRPHATRLAAIACLLWWCGLGLACALLMTPAPWQLAAAVALAAASSAAILRWTAALARRAELREQARQWTALPALLRTVTARNRVRPATAGWLVAGLTAVAGTVATTLLAGRADLMGSALVTVSSTVGVCVLAVLLVIRRARPH
jgi:hypothetical protein